MSVQVLIGGKECQIFEPMTKVGRQMQFDWDFQSTSIVNEDYKPTSLGGFLVDITVTIPKDPVVP